MHDAPSAKELVEAVKSFIDNTAMTQLTGHAAFHARVASNALATVLREMEQRPAAEEDERARLQALLNSKETDVAALNRALCVEIQAGRVDLTTPSLLTHLKSTTIDQLSVDQPGYSGLRTAAR
ncbi:MAG: DUF6285 domain-containing protein [Hyphomonas sp.]